MKVELLVSEWCPACPQAEKVWRQVADEREIEFAVLDMMQPEGRELAQRLHIRTIPAVVVDGVLQGVGVLAADEARRLVAAAAPRRRASPRHAGLLLSNDNRLFILAAMAWLLASGAWLLAHGSLLADGAPRAAGVHLFTAGCVLQLIYGLAAHMLPRFTGNPMRAGVWPLAQFACHNLGVVLFVVGHGFGMARATALGAVLLWLALLVHAVRVWPVLWPPAGGGTLPPSRAR